MRLSSKIEKELKQVGQKQSAVVQQVSSLVEQANDLCLLHKEIQGTVNRLYSQLKAKKLADEGVDLLKESNWYKYDSHIFHALIYGDFLKVELEKTMV